MTIMRHKLSTPLKTPTFIRVVIVCLYASFSHAQAPLTLAPPADPTQSMRYWQPHVINPQHDPQVAVAHKVFQHLLRAWDKGRIAPSLQVVTSSQGPWAASLSDGNILLSRDAINISQGFGAQRSEHLLAFVLAHELAHQKTNDLWHQQFFRMVGRQSKSTQQQLLKGLNLAESGFDNLQALETQADQDAVVLMTSVGFDANLILHDAKHQDSNFYQLWVESIWQDRCGSAKQMANVCEQAKLRGMRTQVQIETMAQHSILYRLALQSLVAQDYQRARDYLLAYGRNYPSRMIHNALGLSYLAQALPLWQQLMQNQYGLALFLPLYYDSETAPPSLQGKRGYEQQQSEIQTLTNDAIHHFTQAQTLAPQHPSAYLNLAMAYLMQNNRPMVEGTIRGQYVRRFQSDLASELLLLLAGAFSYEGPFSGQEKLTQQLTHLASNLTDYKMNPALSKAAIEYALYLNLTSLSDDGEAKQWWQRYAQQQMANNEVGLFKMALAKLQPKTLSQVTANLVQTPCQHSSNTNKKRATLWVNGNPLYVTANDKDYWMVHDANQKIRHCWLSNVSAKTHPVFNDAIKNSADQNQVKQGDDVSRLFIRLGQPTRRFELSTGRYLAYDERQVAFKIDKNKVVEWFYYAQ